MKRKPVNANYGYAERQINNPSGSFRVAPDNRASGSESYYGAQVHTIG
ncbi:MAG: hypothetical protein KF679_04435 [Chitinophagaceae bacterium]|nr:hypothetical protein [Chitinophagaceae bacterium]